MALTQPVLCLALLSAFLPSSGAVTLESVSAAMDKSAASFRSMSGKLRTVTYTKILNDTSEPEIGSIIVKRTSSKDLKVMVEVTSPDKKAYLLQGRKGEFYYPKLKTIQEYDLGKHRNLVDQFLLLGFGTRIAELQKSYDIKLGGEETVAGQKTARLELIPKSLKFRESIQKAELWVTQDGRTVQQKLYEASGDYRLFTYTDVKWNVDLPESSFKFSNLPKDVKRERPQK